MKALPPNRNIDFKTEQKYWSEILTMCYSPALKHGKKVRIIKDGPIGSGIKIGRTGVVRHFNPVDYKTLYEKYVKAIEWIDFDFMEIPDMSAVFDFFGYTMKNGKKVLAVYHTHINASMFEYVDNQLNFEL